MHWRQRRIRLWAGRRFLWRATVWSLAIGKELADVVDHAKAKCASQLPEQESAAWIGVGFERGFEEDEERQYTKNQMGRGLAGRADQLYSL